MCLAPYSDTRAPSTQTHNPESSMQGMGAPFLRKYRVRADICSRERFPLENGDFRTIEGSSQIGMLLSTVERWRAEGLRQSWCEQGRGRALGI